MREQIKQFLSSIYKEEEIEKPSNEDTFVEFIIDNLGLYEGCDILLYHTGDIRSAFHRFIKR